MTPHKHTLLILSFVAPLAACDASAAGTGSRPACDPTGDAPFGTDGDPGADPESTGPDAEPEIPPDAGEPALGCADRPPDQGLGRLDQIEDIAVSGQAGDPEIWIRVQFTTTAGSSGSFELLARESESIEMSLAVEDGGAVELRIPTTTMQAALEGYDPAACLPSLEPVVTIHELSDDGIQQAAILLQDVMGELPTGVAGLQFGPPPQQASLCETACNAAGAAAGAAAGYGAAGACTGVSLGLAAPGCAAGGYALGAAAGVLAAGACSGLFC
jgi:hypothetical protein